MKCSLECVCNIKYNAVETYQFKPISELKNCIDSLFSLVEFLFMMLFVTIALLLLANLFDIADAGKNVL